MTAAAGYSRHSYRKYKYSCEPTPTTSVFGEDGYNCFDLLLIPPSLSFQAFSFIESIHFRHVHWNRAFLCHCLPVIGHVSQGVRQLLLSKFPSAHLLPSASPLLPCSPIFPLYSTPISPLLSYAPALLPSAPAPLLSCSCSASHCFSSAPLLLPTDPQLIPFCFPLFILSYSSTP
jgi:hypothetical protein